MWGNRPKGFWLSVLWIAGVGLYKLVEHWALNWVPTQIEPGATPALKTILGYVRVYIPIITWFLVAAGLIWMIHKAGKPTPGGFTPTPSPASTEGATPAQGIGSAIVPTVEGDSRGEKETGSSFQADATLVTFKLAVGDFYECVLTSVAN